MKWNKTKIITAFGEKIADAPVIISASRSTDIPAFYSDWFMNSLRRGYSKWINPFNRKEQYISYADCRMVVFWSKNPKPMLKYLDELNSRNIKYYFQFTLNDYGPENLEPNVPPLRERIDTLKALSDLIGKEKVIWRFDPIILSLQLGVSEIVSRIKAIGDEIHSFTEKLVFSFADIDCYNAVRKNLDKTGVYYREPRFNEIMEISDALQTINKDWKLQLATCAEKHDLTKYGIFRNKCIDDCLISKICNNSKEVLDLLGRGNFQMSLVDLNTNKLKDTGQRKECGCIISKDIGQYNTCMHLCAYCYANHSKTRVLNNYAKFTVEAESIIS